MAERSSEEPVAPRPPAEPIKLDFRRAREAAGAGGRRKALSIGGMVLALLLMFAASAITVVARQRWGLYLFMAAAVLYLVSRCMQIGLLNTVPKALGVVCLVAGAVLLSNWKTVSLLGKAVGVACVAVAFGLLLVYGCGLAGKRSCEPPVGR